MLKGNILLEKEYQKFILDRLKDDGYEVWSSNGYNSSFATYPSLLFRFLNSTQPEKMVTLNKIYKEETEEVILAAINEAETKVGGGRQEVLKHGIYISNIHLDLFYSKPATILSQTAYSFYQKNILSVSEEVWASETERVDLVLFVNGLAVVTMELKANTSGQSYQDAIYQYRMERSPKTRLFRFKSGALVHFAMDLEEVYMTTKLDGAATVFHPFNMGNGEGINAGAGNPIFEDKYSVSYMWESILTKESLLDIISSFMFTERKEEKNEKTGKTKVAEFVIFPRYHQLDLIRRLEADILVNKTSQNYLLQHSAGSGKTNEIAWLAHRLASLHDKNNKNIFDNIIICTDRVVVDRQLQQAALGIEHKSGLIRVMNDKCTSADLAKALSGNTKIIATTIQKFPYIVGSISNMQNKKFAVIIDEAHSSTNGKNMAAVTYALSEGLSNENSYDAEDMIVDEIARNGKQPNVSMFAFTATPKPTTLQMFGRTNKKGQKEAFHIYSMKQAIEEGYILDPLQNYTTYKTYYTLNKEIQEDPMLQTNEAKRQISKLISIHQVNIDQRIEIMLEHFRLHIMHELGGKAKVMVPTDSRESAVRYFLAFKEMLKAKGYSNIKALVAFSGKVIVDGKEYTESMLNGIPEKCLPAEFDKDEYRFLFVANKYQTGFDQKKLSGMYILKKLNGIATVQTLSRLNRICPPYDKKTFVLDFVNDYKDITRDFSQYYTTTLLSNSVTPVAVYDIEAKLDGFYFLDPMDIEDFNQILYSGNIGQREQKKMNYLLEKAKRNIEKSFDKSEQDEIIVTINHFIRFYEFLLQVSCFEDVELHKKYNFIRHLSSYFKIKHHGNGYNLIGKIEATNFVQKKIKSYEKSKVNPNPIVKLPVADKIILSDEKEEKLSEIIGEINSKMGRAYDSDVAIKSMLQIIDIMVKSEELKASAKNNNEKDFKFAFFDIADKALIDGLAQNQDFYSMLLQNTEIKRESLTPFIGEIYKKLREV